MKTLAILLLASLSLTTGCATDPNYPDGDRGLRPGHKPSLDPNLPDDVGGSERQPSSTDRPDIDESYNIPDYVPRDPRGVDDGRVVWAEEVIIDHSRLIELHQFDTKTGEETIEILDENGASFCCIEPRQRDIEIRVDGVK